METYLLVSFLFLISISDEQCLNGQRKIVVFICQYSVIKKTVGCRRYPELRLPIRAELNTGHRT